jgi:hypothetical protein
MGKDGKDFLQLSITAIGQPASNSTEAILEWLDLGRHAVVQGFSDFTSTEIQTTVWERI